MRKFSVYAACSCAVAAFVFFAMEAGTAERSEAASALTGKMATMQFLVGSWNCNVKIGASPGQPATTAHGIVAFSVAPGNTLHNHVTADEYGADTYTGFVEKSKTFWMNTVDVYSNLSGETSSDGKIFTGTTMGSTGKSPLRDTLTHPSATTIRDYQEYQAKGVWTMASDSVCTRL
ncbi:MAG TPA: hypothetical protein VII69_10220 [Candidatus Eremiobacteraceae bacterium]